MLADGRSTKKRTNVEILAQLDLNLIKRLNTVIKDELILDSVFSQNGTILKNKLDIILIADRLAFK
jgi:hypothetical protein